VSKRAQNQGQNHETTASTVVTDPREADRIRAPLVPPQPLASVTTTITDRRPAISR
jgi:hypothetical protein